MDDKPIASKSEELLKKLDSVSETFGSWLHDLETLNKSFTTAPPFPNVQIDNFFKADIAEEFYRAFPKTSDDQNWIIYNNPIEKKYALIDFSTLPQFEKLFALFQTDEFITTIKNISGIDNLEADPHLHGAGLHQHHTGGKLDMHLDYSIHPITGKERRVNLIIYLTKDWKEEYGGAIQFWNENFTKCEKKLTPDFNTAVLFRTSDVSYHGLPHPIECPEDNTRKSIAIYYVSEPRPDLVHVRLKAQFRPLPDQPINEKLEKLYRIREKRTITKQDLETIYPNWETDGNGYW